MREREVGKEVVCWVMMGRTPSVFKSSTPCPCSLCLVVLSWSLQSPCCQFVLLLIHPGQWSVILPRIDAFPKTLCRGVPLPVVLCFLVMGAKADIFMSWRQHAAYLGA
jgi:hypothetical protein